MTKNLELSDNDMTRIIKSISEPAFKYILKQIKKKILVHNKMSQISINDFLNILVCAMAATDSNLFRWAENFYNLKMDAPIDFDKLKRAYFDNLNYQLRIVLQ